MKLIIEESKWLQGEGSLFSTLYRPKDGKMCCLGFYLLATGVPLEKLNHTQTPFDNKLFYENVSEWLFKKETQMLGYRTATPDCAILIEANDKRYLDEDKRKAIITETFAKHDVQVEFVP